MKHYWKLFNWEISRFSKFYAVLGLFTLVLQFARVILYANSYMNQAHEVIHKESISAAEYIVRFGKADFTNITFSLWFAGPIALCAAALLLYVFLIWYREWFGKNTFAFRLLMLPTSRMNVYLAKLSAILVFVLGLVAFQLLLLPIQVSMFNAMIPGELRDTTLIVDVIAEHELLKLLLPRHFSEFVINYGIGLTGVIVLFTAILLERSFRFKGIAAGVVYGVGSGYAFFLPILIGGPWYPDYFYPGEILLMEVLAVVLINGCSLWFSSYLLRNKVTV